MKFCFFPSLCSKNQDHSDFIGLLYGARSTIVTSETPSFLAIE